MFRRKYERANEVSIWSTKFTKNTKAEGFVFFVNFVDKKPVPRCVEQVPELISDESRNPEGIA